MRAPRTHTHTAIKYQYWDNRKVAARCVLFYYQTCTEGNLLMINKGNVCEENEKKMAKILKCSRIASGAGIYKEIVQ